MQAALISETALTPPDAPILPPGLTKVFQEVFEAADDPRIVNERLNPFYEVGSDVMARRKAILVDYEGFRLDRDDAKGRLGRLEVEIQKSHRAPFREEQRRNPATGEMEIVRLPDASVERLQKQVAQFEARMAKCDAQLAELGQSRWGHLLQALEPSAMSYAGFKLEVEETAFAPLPASKESFDSRIATKTKQRNAMRAKLQKIKDAPETKADKKERLESEVRYSLDDPANRPDQFGLFPQELVGQFSRIGEKGEVAHSLIYQYDVPKALRWFDPDKYIARLHEDVDRYHDETGAVPKEDKAKLIPQYESELYRLNHELAALYFAATKAGSNLKWPLMSPHFILGCKPISATMVTGNEDR